MTPDMQRVDGTQKSETGFLGPIPNTVTGKTMTEVSMGIEIDGEEVLIPLLVPSLTEEEIKIMQNMEIEGNIENVPQSIKDKAVEHAIQRMKENKNPFYNNDKAEGGSIDNITATEEEVQNLFGLEPNIDRPMLLPLPLEQEDGSRKLTAPQILYDAARAFVAPGVAAFKGGVTEEDVINFGLTYTGAGVASKITTGGAKATARQIDDTFLKPTRENKEFIDKTRKEGVFHADVGQKPYSRLESSIESHLVPMYNPHHSVDDTLKIRFEQIDQDQFVTPIKALSPNFPVSLGSRNIAEVYQKININPNAKHQALISSDSAFLYKGKLKENTLQNLFDFNLRKHVKKLRPILKRKENSDMFPLEVGQGGETVATYRNADELINSYEFKEGHWELLEHPKIVNAIREAGYDGSIVTEMYTINSVRQRLKQLQIYDGSLVEDLELVIDALPDLYKRLDHLKKNGQIYRSSLAESGFNDQIHNKINKNNQAIKFVENLILKKDGRIRKMGEENFSEDELKLLEEQGYIGKVEVDK